MKEDTYKYNINRYLRKNLKTLSGKNYRRDRRK